ncbi:hypothetical protein VE02_08043 [Pseudogymnoascus sp. 03VT05]|nr:hypothetical protein VE02_08043 [Pseudogymnoascus sp. 03VT05]
MISSAMKAIIAALAVLSAPVLADLGKPVLFKDGLGPHVNTKLMAHMPSTKSTHKEWAHGTIPESCAKQGKNANPPLKPSDFHIFDVHYTDCAEAWIMCRHKDAQLSINQLIDYFGRLPVHERQSVSYVMGVPGGGSAYEIGGMVVFQGNTASISVFQHEVGHAVDAYNNADGTSSSKPIFAEALKKDSCVPDAYANTNKVEDWTQVSVLLMYDKVVPGGLNTIGANWACLGAQLVAVANRQGAAMNLGGKCTKRLPYGKVISMGGATARGESAVDIPVMTLVPGHPLVVEVDTNRGGEVTHFTDLTFNETEDALAAERQAAWNAETAKSTGRRVGRNF